METHEALSLAIAASDLRYVAGSILSAGTHPRSWPFAQWGAMVTYESVKTLRGVHGLQVELSWEPKIAAAARHGGKFFDVGRDDRFEGVIADFRALTVATHSAFYPNDRKGRFFDFLRDDFAVLTDESGLILTNVAGHFMVGMPPDRAVDMESWGPHLHELSTGIGQLTATFLSETVDDLRLHGSKAAEPLAWWDGKIDEVVPAIFGGELSADLAMAVLSIFSTVKAARRWTFVGCCGPCAVASLKHRFVVLHHAARSIQQLAARSNPLQPLATRHLTALADQADLHTVTGKSFRQLRNGWFHLGLGDIASSLKNEIDILSPIGAYTRMEVSDFIELVDRGLKQVALGIGSWLAEPGADGQGLFDCLHSPSD